MTTILPDKAREFAVSVVKQLQQANYQAYWAGGCVRDRFLGIEPKDYDVATNALPDQIQEVHMQKGPGHLYNFQKDLLWEQL